MKEKKISEEENISLRVPSAVVLGISDELPIIKRIMLPYMLRDYSLANFLVFKNFKRVFIINIYD